MEEIKAFRKSLLSKVVRMEAMEAKFGIEINHLTFVTEPDETDMTINFELLAPNGISENIYINFAFYDDDDGICAKDFVYIYADDFAGFAIESTSCDLNARASDISRIVVYPSK